MKKLAITLLLLAGCTVRYVKQGYYPHCNEYWVPAHYTYAEGVTYWEPGHWVCR